LHSPFHQSNRYGNWADTDKALINTFVTGLSGSTLQAIQTTYGNTDGKFIARTFSIGAEYVYTSTSKGTTLTAAQVFEVRGSATLSG